jgi:hypothetical protein
LQDKIQQALKDNPSTAIQLLNQAQENLKTSQTDAQDKINQLQAQLTALDKQQDDLLKANPTVQLAAEITSKQQQETGLIQAAIDKQAQERQKQINTQITDLEKQREQNIASELRSTEPMLSGCNSIVLPSNPLAQTAKSIEGTQASDLTKVNFLTSPSLSDLDKQIASLKNQLDKPLSQDEINAIKQNCLQQDSVKKMSAEIDQLETKLNAQSALIKKNGLEQEKLTEAFYQHDLNAAQIVATKTQIAQLEKMSVDEKDLYNYNQYLRGITYAVQGNTDLANNLFKELQATDLASNPQVNLQDLIKQTEHRSWFQRNWQTVAKVGAVAAGVAAGIAAGMATGPGGILVGETVTETLLAGVSAAGAMGYLGGGTVYSAVKASAEGLNSLSFSDFNSGGCTGAISAEMSYSTAVLGRFVGQAADAANASKLPWSARIANYVWSPQTAIAAGASGIHQGYEVLADKKTIGEATVDFTREFMLSRLFIGNTPAKMLLSPKALAAGITAASARGAYDLYNGANPLDTLFSLPSESLQDMQGLTRFKPWVWPALRSTQYQLLPAIHGTIEDWKYHNLTPNRNEMLGRIKQMNPAQYQPDLDHEIETIEKEQSDHSFDPIRLFPDNPPSPQQL